MNGFNCIENIGAVAKNVPEELSRHSDIWSVLNRDFPLHSYITELTHNQ